MKVTKVQKRVIGFLLSVFCVGLIVKGLKLLKVEPTVRLFFLFIFGFSWSLLGEQDSAAAPTGTIAFLSSRDSKPPHKGFATAVYLVDADGSNERKWMENPQASFSPIAWSPDGKHVAFHMQTQFTIHIFLMNVLTKKRKNVTRHFGGREYLSPKWSGDGKWLVLTHIAPDGMSGVYVMDAGGNELKNLTRQAGMDDGGSWSPDSSKIVFYSGRDGNGEIYVMDSNGRNQVNLTNHPAFDTAPTWSPDGKKIAFDSRREGGQTDIYVMNPDGTDVVNLTRHPWQDYAPAWSPNGRWIAFHSFRKGLQPDIYVMDANGDNRTQVTHHPGSDTSPTWVIPDRSLSVEASGHQVTLWGRMKLENR